MTALLYESGMNEFILKWQHALYSLPGLKILRGITESRVVVGPGVRPTQLILWIRRQRSLSKMLLLTHGNDVRKESGVKE